MSHRSFYFVSLLIAFLFDLGCVTARPRRPLEQWTASEVWEQIDQVGQKIQAARGEVWMKVRSRDASGQFPASVVANSQDRTLNLVVTNLIGGTEALIKVKGSEIKIEVPGKPEKSESGYGFWGGIPLEFAPQLFLGQLPKPHAVNQMSWDASKMELKVLKGADLGGGPQTFIYHVKVWGERLWPDALIWDRQLGGEGQAAALAHVEFKFEDPDDQTFAPKKWEATSSGSYGQGQVKVRWKKREQIDTR